MLPKYALQIIDTGETIIEEYSDRFGFQSMVGWQKYIEPVVLKDGRRSEAIKQQVKDKNTIVAWLNYDEMLNHYSKEEFESICSKIFGGYDIYFNER